MEYILTAAEITREEKKETQNWKRRCRLTSKDLFLFNMVPKEHSIYFSLVFN